MSLLWAFVSCENRAIARNDVTAKHQVKMLTELLEQYRDDVGAVPSDDAGLNALLTRPAELGDSSAWKGPYVIDYLPTDPWGNDYFYEAVDDREFRVGSSGKDGVPQTTDDITN